MTAPIAALITIARSIVRLAREHGIDGGNAFTIEEIAGGAALSPRLAGRYLKAHRDEIRQMVEGHLEIRLTLERRTDRRDRRRYVVIAPAGAKAAA